MTEIIFSAFLFNKNGKKDVIIGGKTYIFDVLIVFNYSLKK